MFVRILIFQRSRSSLHLKRHLSILIGVFYFIKIERNDYVNAVLLSLKPRFCNLIISGAKNIEIRKNRPTGELPFKVYVYCPERNTRNSHHILEVHSEGKIYRCNGKIIGEFICEEIISSNDSSTSNYSALEEGSCLSSQELSAYGRGKPLYGWRISFFHLYDRPQDPETLCTTEGKPIHRPPQSWCYARPNM